MTVWAPLKDKWSNEADRGRRVDVGWTDAVWCHGAKQRINGLAHQVGAFHETSVTSKSVSQRVAGGSIVGQVVVLIVALWSEEVSPSIAIKL